MKKIALPTLLIAVVFLILFSNSCKKETASNITLGTEKIFPKVKLIVQNYCTVSCHAPSLGFYDGLPVILETDSLIVYHAAGIKAAVNDPVTPTNKRMPSGGTLSADNINIILQWYAMGGTMNN